MDIYIAGRIDVEMDGGMQRGMEVCIDSWMNGWQCGCRDEFKYEWTHVDIFGWTVYGWRG